MRLRLRTERLRLRRPLRTGFGTITERELVIAELTDGDLTGRGEAAPLEDYDGVSPAAVRAALDVFAAVLEACGPGADHREVLDRCVAERDVPHALAAVDIALWDLEARRAGLPVARLLHPGAAADVPVNRLIAAADRAGAAAEAARAVADGFTCLKLKVGLGDDAGRVAAIRAAVGPAVALRLDANGAWSTPQEALANLRALAPASIELCEEPVHGVEGLAAVRAESPIPIAMDETDDPGAGATDLVCLKVGRAGGITGLLDAAGAARRAGSEVFVASALDGPVAVAAALHAAAALAAEGPLRPCGLATLDVFEGEPALAPAGGRLSVPAGPGLL